MMCVMIDPTMRFLRAVPLVVLLVSGACSSSTEPPSAAVRFPLRTWALSQDFGGWNDSWGGYHLAEDATAAGGDSVFAIARGVVQELILNNVARGYGGIMLVEHELPGETVTALYGHISSRRGTPVEVGDFVSAGELIAFIADDDEDGGSWGPHMHFGIRRGDFDRYSTICGAWLYVGYTRACPQATHEQQRSQWLDPSDHLSAHGAVLPEP